MALKDRAYEIGKKKTKFYGYQTEFVSMIYKSFGKKLGSGANVNEQLGEELHKQVIKKFK